MWWLKRACNEAIDAVKALAATLAKRAAEEARADARLHALETGRANHVPDTGVLHTSKCCGAILTVSAGAVARATNPARFGCAAGTPLATDRDALARSARFARATRTRSMACRPRLCSRLSLRRITPADASLPSAEDLIFLHD